MLFIYVVGGLTFITIIDTIGTICHEKRLFNKGTCRKCGGRLSWFDCDSQSGRGYACQECDNIVWVSYRIVDKNYKEDI